MITQANGKHQIQNKSSLRSVFHSLGVSVAFLLKFTEQYQNSGKLLPTDSSNDVVEKIIKLETAGAKCSFVDHLAACKDELAFYV
eukprot:g77551.t1